MTHLEALEKTLWLAITAQTKKKSTMALELANDLAYGISREELEVIKAGIEKRVSLIQKKRIYECDYEECSKLFLSDEEHGVGRPTTTCSLEHRNKQKTIAATLRKRKLRQKNKLASVRKDFQ